jgi:hypothetical protein
MESSNRRYDRRAVDGRPSQLRPELVDLYASGYRGSSTPWSVRVLSIFWATRRAQSAYIVSTAPDFDPLAAWQAGSDAADTSRPRGIGGLRACSWSRRVHQLRIVRARSRQTACLRASLVAGARDDPASLVPALLGIQPRPPFRDEAGAFTGCRMGALPAAVAGVPRGCAPMRAAPECSTWSAWTVTGLRGAGT